MRREVDKFVKDKLADIPIEYDGSHWNEMKDILDEESSNRTIGLFYWGILVFALMSFAIFIVNDLSEINTPQTPQMELAENSTGFHIGQNAISTVEVNKSSKDQLREMGNRQLSPDHSSIAYLNDESVNSEYSGDRRLETLPAKENHFDNSDPLRGQSGIDIAYEDLDNRLPFNDLSRFPNATGSLPLFDLEESMNDQWGVGVGLHLENSWGWSTGAFAAVDYRFHRVFSLSVRPGLTFQTNNTPKPASKHNAAYDLGYSNIQGDVEPLESYAVDMPMSVQFHNQRHLVSVGGGVHYAFLQRISINENHFANIGSFTGSDPVIFESTSNRNTWVEPGKSLYPFAELYYSYLLTPSFELGGRSRVYMPDNFNMNKNLNFAAQLVWRIN